MTVHLWYQPGINSALNIDISDRLRMYTVDVAQNAEEGSVALSTIVVDDPLGDFDIGGWHRLYLTEDAATGSNTFISNGYVTGRTIERGPYLTGAGRIWRVTVADSNAVGQWKIMEQSAANRPAETDVERIQWLVTTDQMRRIPDSSMVSTASPVAMDAVDYRGQHATDVLDDCAQASGKNWFTWYSKTGLDTIGLWYDVASSTAWESPVRLTNVYADVLADPYGLTFSISDDTALERDPSRVYSGAYVQYDGGVAYAQSFVTGEAFTWRDAIVPAENVKTQAKAAARATRYLTEMSTEEDRITTAFRVPSDKVNFLREGMRVQFKASHLPGYETFYQWMRVLKRTVKQDSETEYLITVELSQPEPPQLISPVVAGASVWYADQDNNYTMYVNGTLNNDSSAGLHHTDAIAIPTGRLVSGDNVVAVRIDNGVEPATWDLGNITWLEGRVFDANGTLITYTTTSAKTWLVSNLAGTIDGTPANWNTAAFDDSAWLGAVDASSYVVAYPPISPARQVAPAYALTGTQGRGLVWLLRLNFTI